MALKSAVAAFISCFIASQYSYHNLGAINTHMTIFTMAQHPLVGQGFLIFETSRSNLVIHTTLGRTPLDEGSVRQRELWQHTAPTRDKHTCSRRYSSWQSQQASGRNPHVRPSGRWNRYISMFYSTYSMCFFERENRIKYTLTSCAGLKQIFLMFFSVETLTGRHKLNCSNYNVSWLN